MSPLPVENLNLTLVDDSEVNVPLVIIYSVQVLWAIFLLTAMDYIPRILGVVFVVGVAVGYPVSYFADLRVYEFGVDDDEWSNAFLKVCLVVFLATVPMIWFFQAERMESVWFGRFITTVLGLNILYTMLFEFSVLDTCAGMRMVCCVLMCISLALRVYISEQKNQPVIYKTPKEPYTTVLLTPVTTLWVFAYTLWNISYSVAAFGVRTAIHILTLYIGVGYEFLKYSIEVTGPRVFLQGYKLDRTFVKVTNERAIHDTPDAPPLGWFFGYVRAITLGGYMMILPLIGMMPFVNDTFVTFEIRCNTEIAIYNTLTMVLFVIDLIWAILEYFSIRQKDIERKSQAIAQETIKASGDDI